MPPWIGQKDGSTHVELKSDLQIGEYDFELQASPVPPIPPGPVQIWPVFGQSAMVEHDLVESPL
ncbi:MAG: hypothetical protein E6H68_06975, partial [Betaproteobacteria bacterium]